MGNTCLRLLFLFVAIFTFSLKPAAQELVIRGRVIDSLTGKPVSFASVVSNTQRRGTNANVDGYFRLSISKPGEMLTVSSIGYDRRTVTAREGMNQIVLVPTPSSLEAIVVRPNDEQDPYALAIIRQSIANRKLNDPEELNSFSYNSYSKGIVDTLKADIKKASGKVVNPEGNDTGRYQFMVESYFENKYRKPGLYNNRMTAQKVSGLGNPYIIGLITQIQYFSFYKEEFKVLGKAYRNPVSSKYYRNYVFSLVDSIRGDDDKYTYIIAFRPRYKAMGLDLMKGQVHIHADDYAIVNVEASAYFSSATSSVAFKQNYERVENRWFPKQLQTQLMLLPEEEEEEGDEQDAAVKFNVTSYLKDVRINPELNRSTFGNYEFVVDESSGKRSESYWEQVRERPLDASEIRTYKHLDSVYRADTSIRKMERRMDVIGYLVSGKIPVGKINIELRDIVKLNEFETIRLGMGLSTNDRFSEHHKFGISGGYGFRDRAWKYGGFYEYKYSRDADLTFGIAYRKDIQLWGMSPLLLPGIRIRNYQYLLTDRADDLQRVELYSKFKMLKKAEAVAFVNYQDREFNHAYSFSTPKDPGSSYSGARIYEAGLRFNTRFRQSKIKYGSLTLNGFAKDDPRLAFEFRVGRSVDEAEGLNYVRLEGLYENNLTIGRIGKLRYTLAGGHIDGTTPYSMLFNNLGTNRRSFDLLVPSTFSSMAPFEFTSTTYGALYTEFESGYIIQKRKKWGISLFIPNNIGVGRYDQDMSHNSVVVRQMDQLYSETGLGLKFRTRNRMIGFAAMYRYGNYSAEEFGDNVFFRVLVDR